MAQWIQCQLFIVIHYTWSYISGGHVYPKQELYLPDYSVYHNLSSIGRDLMGLAAKYPGYIQLDDTYRSRQNRPQIMLRVSDFSSGVSSSKETQGQKVRVSGWVGGLMDGWMG